MTLPSGGSTRPVQTGYGRGGVDARGELQSHFGGGDTEPKSWGYGHQCRSVWHLKWKKPSHVHRLLNHAVKVTTD